MEINKYWYISNTCKFLFNSSMYIVNFFKFCGHFSYPCEVKIVKPPFWISPTSINEFDFKIKILICVHIQNLIVIIFGTLGSIIFYIFYIVPFKFIKSNMQMQHGYLVWSVCSFKYWILEKVSKYIINLFLYVWYYKTVLKTCLSCFDQC